MTLVEPSSVRIHSLFERSEVEIGV
jgi:hypothetical protein